MSGASAARPPGGGDIQDLQAAWQKLILSLEHLLSLPATSDQTSATEGALLAQSALVEQCNVLLVKLAAAQEALQSASDAKTDKTETLRPLPADIQHQVSTFRQTLLDRAAAAARTQRQQQEHL